MLDLVLSNDDFLVTGTTVAEPFSTSDHYSVKFSILMCAADNVSGISTDVVKYDFNRADWTAIDQYMSVVD